MSLKTKIALAVSFLFVLFVTTASYFSFAYFEHTFKKSISAQQFSLVSSGKWAGLARPDGAD